MSSFKTVVLVCTANKESVLYFSEPLSVEEWVSGLFQRIGITDGCGILILQSSVGATVVRRFVATNSVFAIEWGRYGRQLQHE